MTVQDVWDWLNGFAPFATQESFDNAGLLVGNPTAEVRRVLFTLDATLPVVREASGWRADLIVAHHPLMFGGIRAIRYDQPEGAILAAVATARMNLIATHTNFDQAEGGTGDSLAAALGLEEISPTLDNLYLRTGSLPSPQTASDFLATLNRSLGAQARLYGNPTALLRRVTVGAGAIGEEYALVSADAAQAYIVGEIKHHEILAALALGTVVYEVGHHASEQPGIAALYQRFQSAAHLGRWPVEARLTAISPYDCAPSLTQA